MTAPSAVLISITVTPANITVAMGMGAAFRATGQWSDLTRRDLTALATWSSSDPKVVSSAGLDADGARFVAKEVGSVVVAASYCGVNGATKLTVADCGIMQINVSPAGPLTLPVGDSVQLAAQALLCGGPASQDVTSIASWQASSPSVLAMGSGLANAGRATAQSAGVATVSASAFGQTSNTVSVEVTASKPQTITIAPFASPVVAGTTFPLSASATFFDGSTHDVSQLVSFSDSLGVLSLQGNVVTAVYPGTTTLTAAYPGATSNAVTLQITPAVLESIALSPGYKQSLGIGATLSFSAIGTFSNATTKDLSSSAAWSATPPGILTVAGGSVTATAIGSAQVSASQDGITSAAVTVEVTATGPQCVY